MVALVQNAVSGKFGKGARSGAHSTEAATLEPGSSLETLRSSGNTKQLNPVLLKTNRTFAIEVRGCRMPSQARKKNKLLFPFLFTEIRPYE